MARILPFLLGKGHLVQKAAHLGGNILVYLMEPAGGVAAGIFLCQTAVDHIGSFHRFDHLPQGDFAGFPGQRVTAFGALKGFHQLFRHQFP